MKVALVAEWVDAWRGGAETSTWQFIHHLLDNGVELHLFSRSRPSPTPHMHVHAISGASMSRIRRSATFAYRVERLLEPRSFDVIHAVSPCRGADIYQPRGGTVAETIERNLALRGPGAARALKRHANRLNFKQRYMLALEREILGGKDGPVVVAISKYVAHQLRTHYELPDQRIRMIYNGVDRSGVGDSEKAEDRSAVRREFGIADGDTLVLLIAHNFRLKGVARWMEALSSIVRRGVTDVRSLVIGKGESRSWYRRAVRLGIAPYLAFVGPSDRIERFHHAGDVLVHPTYYDPCSRVVLEAMIAGLPCVTTRWDGASEMVEDGVSGFVMDAPDDVAGLADRVVRLRDAGLRDRMGAAARLVAKRVGMDRHAAEMLTLYEEVATTTAQQSGCL